MRISISPRMILWIAAALAMLLAQAHAADGGGAPSKEHAEALFFVQIASLVLVGRLLGEGMRRIGQPSVMGELIGGLVLGPSVFGALWPAAQHALFPDNAVQKGMLGAVSALGILLLLLITGMETDLKLIRKVGFSAVAVSLSGIVLPFLCGFALGEMLPEALVPDPQHRLITSLFLGTALSISSVKIVAMVVREMNFVRRNLGQVILASAVIDDTVGWIVVAIIFSLASSGHVDVLTVGQALVGVALFFGASLTIGRRLVSLSIRWSNDHMLSDAAVVSVILLIMIALALTTQLIGVHTVLGAFMAGILVGESPILTRQIDQQVRGLITGLFAPVFFGVAGLSADLSILLDPRNLLLTAGLIAVASVGKASGAFVGGKLGGLSMRESWALACGMNARGSTEVIVATVGLSMGALSHDMFTMIVAMAVITTMAMPPMLRAALRRVPLGKEEKARLEREEFEAKSFVHRLERILVAVDDSANGKFAARLAGLVAGSRGMAATVLHVGRGGRSPKPDDQEDSAEAYLKAAAQHGTSREEDGEAHKPNSVDVITRVGEKKPDQAVAREAERGYDLLVIGMRETTTPKGEFSEPVNRAAAGFEGPMVIVRGCEQHLDDPKDSKVRILVPITGTEASRRAAEVAIVIGRAADAVVGAVRILGRRGEGKGQQSAVNGSARSESAILEDFTALAERYEVKARVATRRRGEPAEVILRQEQQDRFNLIVMGVNRRPGDRLYFGDVAADVGEKSQASILFVSTALGPEKASAQSEST
jgi:K+:H+ antiporter